MLSVLLSAVLMGAHHFRDKRKKTPEYYVAVQKKALFKVRNLKNTYMYRRRRKKGENILGVSQILTSVQKHLLPFFCIPVPRFLSIVM